MRTSDFTFRSPSSGSIEPIRSRHHTDHPGLNLGFVQQPGDQDSHVNLPLRGSQDPLVPLSAQPPGTYSTTARSMVIETPGFRMEPTSNATQALSSHMAPGSNTSPTTYAASSRYVVTPSSVASPSYMTTPSMTSPFSPIPEHAEAPCTADLDESIRRMLVGGASTEVILSIVKTHKDSKDAGIHRALDTMSLMQTDLLAARINALYTPMNYKRGSTHDGPSPSKRSCKALESNDSTPTAPAKPPPVRLMGCPGGAGICTVKQTSAWRNKAEYIRHLLSTHLEDYKVGDILKCLLCKETDSADEEYPVQGSMLGEHIWEAHMAVRKGLKRAQGTAVAMQDEPGQPSGTRTHHAADAELSTPKVCAPDTGILDYGDRLCSTPSDV